MTRRKPLTWDDEYGLPNCGPCSVHLYASPYLVAACASVGIEHGKSTGQMLREYITDYHDRGHTGEQP